MFLMKYKELLFKSFKLLGFEKANLKVLESLLCTSLKIISENCFCYITGFAALWSAKA